MTHFCIEKDPRTIIQKKLNNPASVEHSTKCPIQCLTILKIQRFHYQLSHDFTVSTMLIVSEELGWHNGAWKSISGM